MAQTTFTATSANDGTARKSASAVYPPDTVTVSDKTNNIVQVSRSFSTYYANWVFLSRWDTSSLSADTITAASLELYGQSKSDADGRNMVGEWYDPDTIGSDDYTETPSDSAFSVPLASLAVGTYNTIPLTAPAGNINKSGYTGLRLHIDGGQPTGDNIFSFYSADNGANKPRLLVTYNPGKSLSLDLPVTLGLNGEYTEQLRSHRALSGLSAISGCQ